jgi:hypothetical protein|tara:strand:- start:9278 stop:9484 length:207 start_codon:yes stop_codon:yes gene_type:complete
MDATQRHSLERKNRIGEIKRTLDELSSRGYELDQEKFIFDICIKYNCTSRTAKEYIQTAKRMQEQELE